MPSRRRTTSAAAGRAAAKIGSNPGEKTAVGMPEGTSSRSDSISAVTPAAEPSKRPPCRGWVRWSGASSGRSPSRMSSMLWGVSPICCRSSSTSLSSRCSTHASGPKWATRSSCHRRIRSRAVQRCTRSGLAERGSPAASTKDRSLTPAGTSASAEDRSGTQMVMPRPRRVRAPASDRTWLPLLQESGPWQASQISGTANLESGIPRGIVEPLQRAGRRVG